jgi:hypothetical protein
MGDTRTRTGRSRGRRGRRRCLVLATVLVALAAAPVGAAQAVGIYPTIEPAEPDGANGWWVSPVTVTWHVSPDALGTTCPAVQTIAIDTPGRQLQCTAYGAGNASTQATTRVIRIDRTPPALGVASAVARLGRATVRWTHPPEALVGVTRAARRARAKVLPPRAVRADHAVDRGLKPGVPYTWTVTAVDQAGNRTSAVVSASWKPPVLQWKRRRHARYYNLQLFRDRKKVLSIWPRSTRLALPGRWRFAGRRRHLGPGRYRWYVWPGFGVRRASRYGRLVARGKFTIR